METVIIDIGDEVACDYCNGDSEETGGMLFMGYAICPICTAKTIQDYRREGKGLPKRSVDAVCPEYLSFHDFVLSLRNGDNTIKITSSEDYPIGGSIEPHDIETEKSL